MGYEDTRERVATEYGFRLILAEEIEMNSLLVSAKCVSFLLLHSLKFSKDSFNFQFKSFQEFNERAGIGFEPSINGRCHPRNPFFLFFVAAVF